MLKVGITGNIGSGKTTICKIFEMLGVEVYYADDRAKRFLHSDKTKTYLKELFGEQIFDTNGNIVNKKLAEIVFNDKNSLQKLNDIIHPQVHKDFEEWVDSLEKTPYVLKEAALLFETGSYKELNKIIVVASTTNLMIERVIRRDNVSHEAVKKRLENQLDQKIKIEKADHVIYNDEKTLLIPKVISIHNEFSY